MGHQYFTASTTVPDIIVVVHHGMDFLADTKFCDCGSGYFCSDGGDALVVRRPRAKADYGPIATGMRSAWVMILLIPMTVSATMMTIMDIK